MVSYRRYRRMGLRSDFLKITDREEIFKTFGGKFVAPQMMENKLQGVSIDRTGGMVIGEEHKFLRRLLFLHFANLKTWCVCHLNTL